VVDGPGEASARGGNEPLPKPGEFLALHHVTVELFEMLRRWFAVPDEVSLDLTEIDSAVREMADPVMIAALAMRKLQAVHLISTPGVATTTDVLVSIVQDLDRALIQAPTMRLRLAAETTDWDAALLELEADPDLEAAPAAPDAEDPEERHFRALHSLLHAAVQAVLDASDGEIRVFV
jgi:hypothetical protein